ncbi:MAG: HEAT repeat domain-containing protein [Pseudomonadota bacterium]
MFALPEMSSPPVREVVCGAFFSPLDLDALQLGAYWFERRDRFPTRKATFPVLDTPDAVFSSEYPPCRMQMVSGAGDLVVQLQPDRFYLNWRASADQQYPRFKDSGNTKGIASLLKEEFELFATFCERTLSERPAPLVADLSKVNLLIRGQHWHDFSDLKELLPLLSGFEPIVAPAQPEINVDLLDRRDWTALVKIQSGTEKDPPNSEIIRVEIRTRANLNGGSMADVFDALNDKNKRDLLADHSRAADAKAFRRKDEPMTFDDRTAVCFTEASWAENANTRPRANPRSAWRRQTPQSFFAIEPKLDVQRTPSLFERSLAQTLTNWKMLVPAKFIRNFSAPCEQMFCALADGAPSALARLISSGILDNADLSLAAEALGRAASRDIVYQALLPLLRHTSAIVREGAIYGIGARRLTDDAKAALSRVANKDPSPGVRAAATEAMEACVE